MVSGIDNCSCIMHSYSCNLVKIKSQKPLSPNIPTPLASLSGFCFTPGFTLGSI